AELNLQSCLNGIVRGSLQLCPSILVGGVQSKECFCFKQTDDLDQRMGFNYWMILRYDGRNHKLNFCRSSSTI
ncbi:MAG: hypothetical protein EZS28_042077, partial [Streblomastix strix]